MGLATKQIVVSVTKAKNGKLTFNFKPSVLEVSEKERVVWTRAVNGSEEFEFAALAFYERNPFTSVVVHKRANSITALDYYYGQGAVDEVEVDYDYSVFVKLDDGTYTNSDDWKPIGDGGGPTIRNK